ncbi:hypothetical protein MJM04_31280, partial [Salmonella enterica subsp. enterica serovar Cerro]|nr:hypothetical protein [Salmonella enterica subsp. enterica serovar Cerro]
MIGDGKLLASAAWDAQSLRGREFESRFPLQFLSTVKLSTTNIALGHVLFRFRQILVNRLI